MTIAPPRVDCLERARAAVLERADAYGRPEDLFTAIAARWSLTLRSKLTAPIAAREVALLMDDMKTERIVAGGTDDCWVDKAGYAACGFEVDAQ